MLDQERFDAHLGASGIWPETGAVILGYSGGADSTCLLHLLATGGRQVIAAHLHHGMRAEADHEQGLCAAFAESLGVPFAAGKADVPALAEEQGIGLEEAGRLARYIFLRQTRQAVNGAAIATAHTLTDHAEAILMHVLRGSGRRGLGGIEAKSDDLLRPLLPFTREETRSYCEAHNLWFHDDPANSDDRFQRSRLRNRVFPILKDLNPGVENALARLADVTRDEDVFLDGAAAAALERLEVNLNGELAFLTHANEIALDAPHFRHLPKPLMRRGVRLCFETLGATLDFHQTETVVTQLLEGTSGSITSEGATVIGEWDGARLLVSRQRHTPPFQAEWELTSRLEAEELGWALAAEIQPNEGQTSSRQGREVFLDADTLKGSIQTRSIQPGDRISPLGFQGTRKISDLLSEAHLTKQAKALLPIVEDENGPFWVCGLCLADRVKVNSATKRVVKLVFEPAPRSPSHSH